MTDATDGDAEARRPGWLARNAGSIVDLLIGGAMIAAVFFGLVFTDIHANWGANFWYLAPIGFFIGALFLSVMHHRSGEPVLGPVLRQAVHWAGVIGVMWALFYFARTGHFGESDMTLGAAILLSFGTFLAGVHGAWRMAPIGAAMFGVTAAVALVQANLWTLIGIAALALIAVLLVNRILAWFARPAAAA